jgi:ADP-ribose pyrophosphatase YjhB (NUDIX family)
MKPTLRFTICFLRSGDRVLLLNRKSPPNMGLWNGPGGKLNDGETALDCAKREFLEETDLDFPNARFAGIVTWILHPENSGVAPQLKHFLKAALDDPTIYEHRFVYRNNNLVNTHTFPLENLILV